MSQEHRFCAEIYARLFNLIDPSKPIVISPDGQSKSVGKQPDLCFTFKGTARELRLEAKTVREKKITVQPTQWGWFNNGGAQRAAPHLWIFSDESLKNCWLVEHAAVATITGNRDCTTAKPINLWPNKKPPDSCSLDQLAMKIIKWAAHNGFNNGE